MSGKEGKGVRYPFLLKMWGFNMSDGGLTHEWSLLRFAITAAFVSALWLYGGYLYLKAGQRAAAYGWMSIALVIVAAFGVNAILNKEWLNLGSSFFILIVETWTVKKVIRRYRG